MVRHTKWPKRWQTTLNWCSRTWQKLSEPWSNIFYLYYYHQKLRSPIFGANSCVAVERLVADAEPGIINCSVRKKNALVGCQHISESQNTWVLWTIRMFGSHKVLSDPLPIPEVIRISSSSWGSWNIPVFRSLPTHSPYPVQSSLTPNLSVIVPCGSFPLWTRVSIPLWFEVL